MTRSDTVQRLLDDHGCTYSEEIGFDLASNAPMPLFKWLCASLLFSARISADQGVSAARGLIDAGLTTAQHMCDAGWERRVKLLNASGYARFDESTATKLGKTSQLLLDRYDGDLRKQHDEAEGKPDAILRLLQDFNGIGPLGAAIFCREAQMAWDSLYPFADDHTLETAAALGLPKTAKGLADRVPKKDFPWLVTALTRVALAGEEDAYRG